MQKEIGQFLRSKGMSEKTIKSYCSILNKVFQRLGYQFNEDQLENLFSEFDLKPRTYNLYRSVMNFYTKRYLGYRVEFTKAKVPQSLPNYVTTREFYSILKSTPNFKHKMGLSLMYKSGLRVYEVCRIKKHDIDFKGQIITIRKGKGAKDRKTIIPNDFCHYLELYCKTIGEGYLFKTYRGHISERSFQEILKRALKQARIDKDITLHDLRHSFAINAVNKGIDIEEVRKMLGHSKLSTTQIYLQCKTANLTKIAQIA